MQLYYIRHAQSENNLLWDLTQSAEGRTADPGLTPTGERQAHLLAAHLKTGESAPDYSDPHNLTGFGITHVYCSLMLRAVTTGAIVARALDLPLRGWTDLHETGGMYTLDMDTEERVGEPGGSRAELTARFPELVWPADADPAGWWQRPFEDANARRPRAERVLARLVAHHGDTDDRVALVSHAAFYNHVLRALLHIPPDPGFWCVLDNTGITRIDFVPQEVRLIYTNHVPHLPLELIT